MFSSRYLHVKPNIKSNEFGVNAGHLLIFPEGSVVMVI